MKVTRSGTRVSGTRFFTAAAILGLFVAGCATEPEKPTPPPAPAPQAAPKPPPAPEPQKPAVVTLSSTQLFDFDRAVLKPEARRTLDAEIVAKARDLRDLSFVLVSGHADRLGSHPYNQRLSERRADAVRAYLVSKGFDANRIETIGFGKTSPVKSCPGKMSRKELIACLEPNRRVTVELKGTPR